MSSPRYEVQAYYAPPSRAVPLHYGQPRTGIEVSGSLRLQPSAALVRLLALDDRQQVPPATSGSAERMDGFFRLAGVPRLAVQVGAGDSAPPGLHAGAQLSRSWR